MTPLPKRKLSHKRQGKRRATIKLVGMHLIKCKNCSKPSLPHVICKFCGFYKGKSKKPRFPL